MDTSRITFSSCKRIQNRDLPRNVQSYFFPNERFSLHYLTSNLSSLLQHLHEAIHTLTSKRNSIFPRWRKHLLIFQMLIQTTTSHHLNAEDSGNTTSKQYLNQSKNKTKKIRTLNERRGFHFIRSDLEI